MPRYDFGTRLYVDTALSGSPEGGFVMEELARLHGMPNVVRVGLGDRLRRADTAAVAAIACWQSIIGDWRGGSGDSRAPDLRANLRPRHASGMVAKLAPGAL